MITAVSVGAPHCERATGSARAAKTAAAGAGIWRSKAKVACRVIVILALPEEIASFYITAKPKTRCRLPKDRLLLLYDYGSVSREVGMTARVKIAGHPVHPMLVPIPIGLWIFTLTSDVVFAVTGDPRWEATAFFTLAGGIAGALLAAVPGLFDLLGLPGARERRIGILHMSVNLAIVVVQAINFILRATSQADTNLTIALSALSVAVLLIS